MALHHVENIDRLFDNAAAIVRPGGYIAIADLKLEDGSFHGSGYPVPHNGFDPDLLKDALCQRGFGGLDSRDIFHIARGGRRYPVFLLTGRKD